MSTIKLKVGDKVTRMLGVSISMKLIISEITDDKIICGCWQFDKVTGIEIDEDIGWGPPPLITGSFILEIIGSNHQYNVH